MAIARPLLTLAALSAMGLSTPAVGQDVTPACRLCSPQDHAADDRPAMPVRLDVQATLDFDRLVMAGPGSGSAELRPDGTRRLTGVVASFGPRAMVGQVAIRGEPGRYVRIELPTTIELFGLSGGSIRVESVASDLPAMPRLDSNGMLQFRFGGILKLDGGLDGEFRGDVRIDVEYF